MPASPHRRTDGPTPLPQVAASFDLKLVTRDWIKRSVADVAFDSFAFDDGALCADAIDDLHPALERGRRADGIILAVASLVWPSMPSVWAAAQSKRSANHLELPLTGPDIDPPTQVGGTHFDSTFDLDVDDDDDALDEVGSVLTDDMCALLVEFDLEHGPMIVVFDGAGDATAAGSAAHRSAIFLAREVSTDEDFIETLALATELANRLRPATDD